MLTRCPSCGTSNRVRPWRRGDARCGKCRTDLVLPRPIGFLQRHRSAVLVAAFLAVAAPGLAYFGGRAERFNDEGVALMAQHHNADAVAKLARAVELRPQVAKYHYNLGVAYFRLRQADQASNCFREALRIDPGYLEASQALTLSNVIAYRGR